MAGSAAVLAVAACSSSSSGGSASSGSSSAASAGSGSTVNVSQVTLTIGDQKGTGAEALLQAAGLIGKLPFKAKWVDFTSGPPMVQAMGSGSVDVGGVGDAPPVFAAAGGAQVKIVGARITPPAAGAVVVPKNSPITTIQQLKGKTIAAPEGTTADYHLLTVLASAGLTKKQVTVDNLQPAEALSAFKAGKVDAWDTWSPYIEEAVNQDGGKVLVDGKQYGSPYSFQVASDAALSDKGKAAAINDYEKILNEAYIWSGSHQSTWAQIWGDATGLPSATMLAAAKDDVNTPVKIDNTVITAEQKLTDAFYKAGEIPTDVKMTQYMTSQFNDAVGSSSTTSASGS
ncbi:MAG: ABC transporter substrate-binding protein [Actinobacteria bacterium]|nr:ABC transporter substrate-binding protein [Actinomycetota bacterium]